LQSLQFLKHFLATPKGARIAFAGWAQFLHRQKPNGRGAGHA
jgi:hypothetical protein